MAAGLGVLRLEPRSFWLMTPRELEAALSTVLGPMRVGDPPNHDDLADLMRRYPDRLLSSQGS